MTNSLNEVETLVRKAAIGAGLDPGRAGELAGAALWLTTLKVPVYEIIHRALSSDDGTPLALADGGTYAVCPATSAARIAPLAMDLLLAKRPGFAITLEAVDEPLIIIALAARVAHREGIAFEVKTPVITVDIQPAAAIDLPGLTAARSLELTLGMTRANATSVSQSPPLPARYDPTRIPDNGFAGLDRLAHLTYVPATEQSRLSGAGAGLTDND